MKKVISLILAVIMVFSCFAVSASAVTNEKVRYPIIFIAGSSVDLVDENQNPVSTGFDVLTDDDEGDLTKDDIIAKVVKVLTPFVLEGLPFDEWDNYGDALYNELAPIFEEGQLDGDGNPKFGTGVAKAELAEWDKRANDKSFGSKSTFGIWDYKFRYDWRLSPYDTVDALDAYIEKIVVSTGSQQVCLVGRCLGGNLITAYLDKYGSKNRIAKVVYDETMANGSATINDCLSGKIDFSDKHMQSYLLQHEYYGKEGLGIDITAVNDLLLEVIEKTLDLATQTGVVETVFGSIELLYEKLYAALMPSMLLSVGIATWPSYWTSVCDDDMDEAIDLMFGKEGTARRAEYAGLIEKILYIRDRITIPRERTGEENLYKQFENNYGVEIGVIAGYGLIQTPITVSNDLAGDCTVDLKSASFGATAAGLYSTLSDEYIAEREALGYGAYISPDKKIDASTCLFPDTTWFIKNKHHDIGAGWSYISERFCQYKNYTVSNNYRDISRFTIVKSMHDNSINGFENMTADNCADGPWLNLVEQEPTTESKLVSLMRWFTSILNIITAWFKGIFTF